MFSARVAIGCRRSLNLKASNILQRYPVVFGEISDKEKQLERIYEQMLYQEAKPSFLEYDDLMGYLAKSTPAAERKLLTEKLSFLPPEELRRTAAYTPAALTTTDENNLHSTNRKLSIPLYLIVRPKAAGATWAFPTSMVGPNETLRTAADRALTLLAEKIESKNDPVRFYTISNAPAGHLASETADPPVFYYLSHYIGGTIQLDTDLYSDYAWVSKGELKAYLPKQELDLMDDILI